MFELKSLEELAKVASQIMEEPKDKGDMDHDGIDEPDDKEYLDNKDAAIKKAMKNETLDPKADAGVWIKDFVNSTDPKFDGKSKEERKDMALAAWYAARREAGIKEGTDNDPDDEGQDTVADVKPAMSKKSFKDFHDDNVKLSGKNDDGSDIDDEDYDLDDMSGELDSSIAKEAADDAAVKKADLAAKHAEEMKNLKDRQDKEKEDLKKRLEAQTQNEASFNPANGVKAGSGSGSIEVVLKTNIADKVFKSFSRLKVSKLGGPIAGRQAYQVSGSKGDLVDLLGSQGINWTGDQIKDTYPELLR